MLPGVASVPIDAHSAALVAARRFGQHDAALEETVAAEFAAFDSKPER